MQENVFPKHLDIFEERNKFKNSLKNNSQFNEYFKVLKIIFFIQISKLIELNLFNYTNFVRHFHKNQ